MDKEGADAVIAAFYSAALQPDAWQAAMHAFARLAGGDIACCFLKPQAVDAPTRAYLSGLDQDTWEAGYRRYYHAIDPGYAILARAVPGRMHLMQEHFSDKLVAHSEYFQDFYLRRGVRYSCSGVVKDGDSLTILSAHRAAGQGRYDQRTHGQLQRVLEHLPNVLRLRDTAQQAHLHGRLAWTALDTLPRAILLVDAALRLVFMNQAAQRWLASTPSAPLALRGGQVILRTSSVQQRLAQRVRLACAGLACEHPVPLYLGDDDGRPALEVNILPLAPEMTGDDACLAMLSLRPLFQASARRWPRTAAWPWGLTAAEWHLALALADGVEPSEYAVRQGVRISTVRSQIQAVLGKTGTRRSKEIASLFSALEWEDGGAMAPP